MVEVFKTNVSDEDTATSLVAELLSLYPEAQINFDLEDCDRILRICCNELIPEKVSSYLTGRGFFCAVLN